MLRTYQETIGVYRNKKISLWKERRLIALAQKGCEKSRHEIVLRHVGFLLFRIHKKVIPSLLYKYREDIVSAGVIVLYEKVQTYNLNYRNKRGAKKKVRFVSYIWKRIDGLIVDYLKNEFKLNISLGYRDDIYVA